MSARVIHAGPLGDGQAIKVINNAVAAANAVTVAEALIAAAAGGLDLDAVVAVLSSGSGGSKILEAKGAAMREHDYTPLFRTAHMAKDVALCVEEAGPGRFRSAELALGDLRVAAHQGYAEADFAAVVEAVEGRSGAVWEPARKRGKLLNSSKVWSFRGDCVSCSRRLVKRLQRLATAHLELSDLVMPIAFKEWAVTVRALAEGEQLVTLRKGGIREPQKHFEVEYERFFLYPTFDHQRSDLVRESHRPELRRALEEGVWADGEPSLPGARSTLALLRPTASAFAPGPRSRPSTRSPTRASSTRFHRSTCGRPTTPRSASSGSAASAACPAAAHISHPAAGHGQGARRVRRLPLVAGAAARPPVRGHTSPLG